MNHNEINILSKEELNIQIAKLRNEYFENHLEECYVEGVTPDGLDGWSGFTCPRCNNNSNNYCIQNNYTNNLNHTWDLVDEMISDKTRINHDLFIEYWSDKEWIVSDFQAGNFPKDLKIKDKPRVIGNCDGLETGKPDICLAICRAWLYWKTNDERY